MKKIRLTTLTLALGLLFGLIGTPLSATAESEAPAPSIQRTALLPPDAHVYIRISNSTNFWAMLKKSSIGQLWEDRQFQDFIGNPADDWWEEYLFAGTSPAETEVMRDQFNMLSGEVIMGLNLETEDPYIIAFMTEKDYLRSLEMDEKLRQVVPDTFDIVRFTFQGEEIVQHITIDEASDRSDSWQAHVGNTFIMGPSREWIEKSIIALGKGPVQEPKGHPECIFNCSVAEILNKMVQEEKEQAASSGSSESETIFKALGLMDIDQYTLTLQLRETEMEIDSLLRGRGFDKGLFTLFDLQPIDLPTAGFISGSLSAFESGRINLLRFWREIPVMITEIDPDMLPQFDMVLMMMKQQTGIDFEQDLLVHLGTSYFSFNTVEGEQETTVVALELLDPESFKTGLERLLSAPVLQAQVHAGLKTQDFLDHTLYEIKNSDTNDPAAFVVSGDYLLYGEADGLRQVIRTQASDEVKASYINLPLIREMRSYASSKAAYMHAVDWKKHIAVLIHELQKPDVSSAVAQGWASSDAPLPPPDFNELPSAEHLSTFFDSVFGYAEKTAAGIQQKILLKY